MRSIGSPDQAYADALAGLLLCAGDVLRTAQDVATIRKRDDLSGRIEALRLGLLELADVPADMTSLAGEVRAGRDHVEGRLGLSLGASAGGSGPKEIVRSNVREEIFANFIRRRITRISRAAAHMLLRMLDRPDHFMDHEALAQAARVGFQTPTVRVVKVYICNIRAGLAEHGIDNAIETGRKSYTISRAKAEAILQFLHQLRASESTSPEEAR